MALVNPVLLKYARDVAWAPPGGIEKAAIVPPGGGGGDPSGGGGPPPGGPPPGGDPNAGGGGPPPGAAPPGGDPSGGAGGPPPGPMDPASLQQIVMAVTQAQGGAGGAGGKGKNPKEQLQAAKDKIQIHLLAQIASKLGVTVDPQLLVPPSDPGGEQMAMQEMQASPMMPGGDPNAPPPGAGGAPPPGGDPSAGGGAPPGPGPVQPMDAGQGPIGKAASFGRLGSILGMDEESSIGREYSIPVIRENREKAAAWLSLFRSLRE